MSLDLFIKDHKIKRKKSGTTTTSSKTGNMLIKSRNQLDVIMNFDWFLHILNFCSMLFRSFEEQTNKNF